MLSVSGLRGLVDRSLTPQVAGRFAGAFGDWLRRLSPVPVVVLGRDSRPSGMGLESAVAAGLVDSGCLPVSVGVLSTPGVGVMAEHLRADGAMVVTASHNPIEWNGIKALVKLDGRVAGPLQSITDQIALGFEQKQFDPQYASALTSKQNESASSVHVSRVLEQVDLELIRQRRFRVVVDGVHGAGGQETALLMEALGVDLVHLYGEPTGCFPHRPEPVEANLKDLCGKVLEHGAEIGFAQDPDADRLAVVDETGRYIGEEYTLALSAMHLFDRAKLKGASVVANLSTSRMIDDVARMAGASVLRCPVGEANVVAAMRSCGAVIGGEGNGGVILPEVIFIRDSLVAIALVLEMLAGAGKPLSQVMARIPAYCIIKDQLAMDLSVADRMTPALVKRFKDQKIDQQDGIRIDWPDRWVHVRASNTEPILRLIAESGTKAGARALIDQARSVLGEVISKQ